MWYDWEWVQWAKEEWYRLENKPDNSSLSRRDRWKLLVRSASGFLTVGKAQMEYSTIKEAINLAHSWIESNFQNAGVWVGTGF
jgi:hypothetical protein